MAVVFRKRPVAFDAVRSHQPLVGPLDGVNRTFTSLETFVHISPQKVTLNLRHGGRWLTQSPDANPVNGEYYVSESGGPTTGYDTVNFIRFAPRSLLLADFISVQDL